jgi:hypothetical protein
LELTPGVITPIPIIPISRSHYHGIGHDLNGPFRIKHSEEIQHHPDVGKRTEKTFIVALKANHVHVVQAQVLLAPRGEMTVKQEMNNNDINNNKTFRNLSMAVLNHMESLSAWKEPVVPSREMPLNSAAITCLRCLRTKYVTLRFRAGGISVDKVTALRIAVEDDEATACTALITAAVCAVRSFF